MNYFKIQLFLILSLLITSCRQTQNSLYPPTNDKFVDDSMNKLTQSGKTLPSTYEVTDYFDNLMKGPTTNGICSQDNVYEYTPSESAESGPEPELAASEEELLNNYKKLGGNPKAFYHAMCFFNKYQNTTFSSGSGAKKITNKCKIIINDYTKPSYEKRLFILNRCTGEVKAMQSSHGQGGKRGVALSTKAKLAETSNRVDTSASPSGFFILGDWHRSPSGKSWSPGIKMHGLEKGVNDLTYARGIVLHKTNYSNGKGSYCNGGLASSDDNDPNLKLKGQSCGRTHGCIGVPLSNWSMMTREVKGTGQGGPLTYNFAPDREAKMPNDWCGGDNLWK